MVCRVGTFPPMVPATVAVPLRRRRRHHGCIFFFYFFFSRKKKKKQNLFVFKIKGGQKSSNGVGKTFLKKKKVFVFKIKRGTKIFKRGGKNFLKRVGLFVGSIEGGKIFGVALFCFAWEWGFFLSTPRIGCPRIVGY